MLDSPWAKIGIIFGKVRKYQEMFPQRNRNFKAFGHKLIGETSSKSHHDYINAI